jgi:hypothetical protein
MTEENVKTARDISPIIKEMEEKCPEMTKEFKKIMRDQYELFCNKMFNYGKNNILLGGDVNDPEDRKLAINGIVIRLSDKTNRLINLTIKGKDDVVNESAVDSFKDIINYSIIAQIINNNKWK